MDEFAQSRGDDDLFDDEIVPINTTIGQSVHDAVPVTEEPPQELTIPVYGIDDTVVNREQTTSRGRSRGRGRGRAGSSHYSAKHGLGNSKFATTSADSRPTHKENKATLPAIAAEDPQSEIETSDLSNVEPSTDDPTAVLNAPTGPANPVPPRPPAVKGDRLKTGGIQRPKLTEEELGAKLAAAKERNQNRAAAYAREQADAENFAERERVAVETRAKETADRRAMEGERERNRARKLRGQGRREWDAKKSEADYGGGGRGDRRRVAGPEADEDNDLSMYEWNDHRGRGRGRGRGGRAGRGRGSGDPRSSRGGAQQTHPDLYAEGDFPALPGPVGKPSKERPVADRKTSEVFESTGSASWAEQVEAGEAAKV